MGAKEDYEWRITVVDLLISDLCLITKSVLTIERRAISDAVILNIEKTLLYIK